MNKLMMNTIRDKTFGFYSRKYRKSVAIPVPLTVELDHTQHCCHDEKQQYGVQQDVLADGDATSVC